MLRLFAGACAALLCGCTSANGPLSTLHVLPENFPPQGVAFRRYAAPQFPYQLRPTGVTSGYSVVAVTIDADGRVEDAVAIEATDTAFVAAVLEVTPDWIFEDAPSPTEPRREVMHFQFRRTGVVSQLTHREGAESMFVESEDRFAKIRLVAWDELDEEPTRVAGEQPVTASGRATPAGAVTLSFVIDETGRVRVPVVTGASDPALGEAALAAVEEWRFSPPRQRGQPVLVEARARWGD
jgi:TonB family protein